MLDLLQDGYRPTSRLVGVGSAPWTPEDVGKLKQCASLTAGVAYVAKRCGCALERVEGFLLLVGEIALVRVLAEQLRVLMRPEAGRESQRTTVLRRGFAMSTDRGRPVAGRRRVAEHCARVSGAFGVVG